MPRKIARTYRLTPEAIDLLNSMAERGGVSHQAMLEFIIRAAAVMDRAAEPKGQSDTIDTRIF